MAVVATVWLLAGCGSGADDAAGAEVELSGVAFEGARLAVPSGWTADPRGAGGDGWEMLWRGPEAADGTRAGIEIEVACADRDWQQLVAAFAAGEHEGWSSWEPVGAPRVVTVPGATQAARATATFELSVAATGRRVPLRVEELYTVREDGTVHVVRFLDVAARFDRELADRVLVSVELGAGRCPGGTRFSTSGDGSTPAGP